MAEGCPRAVTEPASDLPEAASRRIGEGAFTSGLTVPDFAACLQMGLQPVGFVQGSCVMQWRWYGMGSPLRPLRGGGLGRRSAAAVTSRATPARTASSRPSTGSTARTSNSPGSKSAWRQGFTAAYDRMTEEATLLGAHGVVGVVDSWHSLTDMGVLEFRLRGTAVRIEDGPPPGDGRLRGPPTWPASAWPSWWRPATRRWPSPPRSPRSGSGRRA